MSLQRSQDVSGIQSQTFCRRLDVLRLKDVFQTEDFLKKAKSLT